MTKTLNATESGLSTVHNPLARALDSQATPPLWSVVSDDLTGLQAIGGEFARLGFSVETGISRLPEAKDLRGIEIFGFDTATRMLSPAQAEARVAEAVRHLAAAGARRFFKHNDSILQGHIGIELRAMISATGLRPIVYCPACPNRRRVTVGAMQIELTENGEPRAGGLRENLIEHVSRSAGLTTRLLDRTALHSDAAREAVADATCDVVIVDAASDEDLDRLMQVTEQAGSRLLAGSVGLAAALARGARVRRRLAQPIIVVAGSLQRVTRQQTEFLLARSDCASIEIPLTLRSAHDSSVMENAIGKVREALAGGLNCVISFSQYVPAGNPGAVYPLLPGELLEQLRNDLKHLLIEVVSDARVPLGGLIVAGGSTADLALREALGVTRLSGLGWLFEGITMAVAKDGARPGLPVVTKSGGWGALDALSFAIDRLMLWRCTQLSPIPATSPATLPATLISNLEGIDE